MFWRYRTVAEEFAHRRIHAPDGRAAVRRDLELAIPIFRA